MVPVGGPRLIFRADDVAEAIENSKNLDGHINKAWDAYCEQVRLSGDQIAAQKTRVGRSRYMLSKCAPDEHDLFRQWSELLTEQEDHLTRLELNFNQLQSVGSHIVKAGHWANCIDSTLTTKGVAFIPPGGASSSSAPPA